MNDTSQIPPRTMSGLIAYRDERRPPGGFLRAVLENDLHGALSKADSENLLAMRGIVGWVFWELPSTAWGSQWAVAQWLQKNDI